MRERRAHGDLRSVGRGRSRSRRPDPVRSSGQGASKQIRRRRHRWRSLPESARRQQLTFGTGARAAM
ncbi:hypothetical protein LG3211_0731 [Lysobacter gummosus]|nr:hypothetical protein LG3211_0731 [Lysobacter gummosus]